MLSVGGSETAHGSLISCKHWVRLPDPTPIPSQSNRLPCLAKLGNKLSQPCTHRASAHRAFEKLHELLLNLFWYASAHSLVVAVTAMLLE